jgi:hypothetical protein
MILDKQTIASMRSAGISFVSHVRSPGGSTAVVLAPDDVSQFIQDRDTFAAQHFGVSRQQYLDWVETDGAPRCGATTKKGKRCANFVKGGIQRTIEEWVELDGGYCIVHGGE